MCALLHDRVVIALPSMLMFHITPVSLALTTECMLNAGWQLASCQRAGSQFEGVAGSGGGGRLHHHRPPALEERAARLPALRAHLLLLPARHGLSRSVPAATLGHAPGIRVISGHIGHGASAVSKCCCLHEPHSCYGATVLSSQLPCRMALQGCCRGRGRRRRCAWTSMWEMCWGSAPSPLEVCRPTEPPLWRVLISPSQCSRILRTRLSSSLPHRMQQ